MRFARWSNSKSVNDLLLLDTTFFIDAERTDAELDQAIHDADDVAIAAITVAELQAGVRLAAGRRRAQRQRFIDEVCNVIPILSYDRSVAAEHGELLVAVREAGRPRCAHDLIIAATARASKRTVVTGDLTAFTDRPGVKMLDHW